MCKIEFVELESLYMKKSKIRFEKKRGEKELVAGQEDEFRGPAFSISGPGCRDITREYHQSRFKLVELHIHFLSNA